MGQVIMKLKVVEQDGVICVVELKQMLECPSSLIVLRFDIMYLHRLEVDDLVWNPSKKAQRVRKRGE